MNKVFSIQRFTKTFETDYRFTVVVWSRVESETKSTYKCLNLCVNVYCRGEQVGFAGHRPNKLITIKKNLSNLNELTGKLINDAIQSAYIRVLSQGQLFNATVLTFDNNRSTGLVDVHGVGIVPIHGCNAHNALTAYNETCCIELTKGQVISCRLGEVFGGLTATDYTGEFNQSKSDSLDHSKLAFMKRNGKFTSGLFA